MITYQSVHVDSDSETLTAKLHEFHDAILRDHTHIIRVACALYEEKTDYLKTFIHSTRDGHAITAYQAKLSEVPSLNALAEHQECRVIDNVQLEIKPGTEHSDWLLDQGYVSSFTVPIYHHNRLIGFLFLDSDKSNTFSEQTQRQLLVKCNQIAEVVSCEVATARLLIATASAIRNVAGLRDFETGMHLTRMAEFSKLIAQNMPAKYGLNDEIIEHIYLFAPLHDIGKIGIPDAILLKKGKLTDEERQIMQAHVTKGVTIADQILENFGLLDLKTARIMRNIIACHHEYMDGSGYPKGVKGDEVPVEARIVTVADIFDALTHERPYKKPWSIPDALAELRKMVDLGKLDENCVNALASSMNDARFIVKEYNDS